MSSGGASSPTGGANAITGGASAVTGGANAVTGGANAVTGGATAVTGGANAVTGGANAVTGGANAVTGGASAITGGTNAVTGGANAITGGTNAVTGGTNAVTGGANAITGGASAVTGGASTHAGGTSAQTQSGGASSGGSVTGGAVSTGGQVATGGASSIDIPELVDLSRTRFLDYGELRVGVTQPVQATTLQFAFTPSTPTQLIATSATAVDATTLDVTLAYYHLPIDYQVTISGSLTDGTRFTTTAVIPGLNNGSRVAFVTKQYGTGDLKSWPNAPAAAATGREAGDGICQAEAEAVGFKGKFVAFLSSSTAAQGLYDAGCRAFGLMGALPNCGQTTVPVDNAPWLSTAGLPIVEGATSIVGNKWLTTIPFHADGTYADTGTQPYRSLSWGGTRPDMTRSTRDCTGWSVATTSVRGDCIGYPGEYLPEFDTNVGDCSEPLKLVCLQVNSTFFGPNTLHHVAGKRVFASTGKLTGAMSFGGQVGIDAADLLCQTDAASAGIANAANFHAYLSTSSADALCHVLGASGAVSNKCGLANLPGEAWRRLDDYPLATPAQFSALSSQYLTTPVLYAADGTRLVTTRERIWTGAGWDGAITNCSNWSLTTVNGYSGVATAIHMAFSYFASLPGTTNQRVYCFEN
jgi:hypothetical protein